jgi:hypothetical protein
MSNFLDPQTLRRTHVAGEMALVEGQHSKWMNAGSKLVVEDVTIPELLAACRMDFTVSKVPVAGLVTLPDGSIQPLSIDAVFGALKTHTDGVQEMIPGVSTGKKYHCVQNSGEAGAFTILEAMRQQGFIRPQAAGQLRAGALSWVFSSLGVREITRLDGTVDPIENHLLSVNSFDGSTRVVHGLSPRNMRCDNALMATLSGLTTRFSFSHTRSAEEAVALANRVIPQIIEETGNLHAVFQELALRKMGVKQFRTFAQEWLDAEYGEVLQTTDDAGIEARAARQATEDALLAYFKGGVGNTGISAWDGFQSVTEYLDHHRDRHRSAVRTAKHLQNDLSSNLFGSAGRAKSRALRMLVKR